MRPYVPIALRKSLREQFGDCCAYCRTAEYLTATTFEFEHIVPLSAGGETARGNLCLACPMCNRFKSDSASATDALTQADVPLFHPQRQSWSDHFAWSEDGTEILGLSSVGRATIEALKMNRPAVVRVRRLWIAVEKHPPAAFE